MHMIPSRFCALSERSEREGMLCVILTKEDQGCSQIWAKIMRKAREGQ